MSKKDKEDDFHKVYERVHFSRYFKRRVLLEYARLKKPNEALRACGFDIDSALLIDKKYASKLIHKWRKELYQNHHMRSFMNCEMTDEALKREIEFLKSEDDSTDRIMEMFKNTTEEERLKKLLVLLCRHRHY